MKTRLLQQNWFWNFLLGPLFMVYILLLVFFSAFRIEHIISAFVTLLLVYWSRLNFVRSKVLPFLIFAYSYDALRFVTPWLHTLVPIHVEGPYRLEQALFGIFTADSGIRIPSEIFQIYTHTVLDLLGAFAYTFFIPIPLALAGYLIFKNPNLLDRFAWAFLFLSYLGFITWYAYPAAAPWYVELYGFGPVDIHTPSNPARLSAIDELLGIAYFQSIYAKGSNVFGALPSMHAAYPLLAWLYAKKTFQHFHWLFCAYWLLVSFSAVYLRHHYLIDVLLGSFYALFMYWIVESVARRLKISQNV